MPAKEKKSLPSIKQFHKSILVLVSNEQHEKLLKARLKLKAPISEIMRHATFEVYLPQVLGEK
jgi:uncharacterized protein YdcH (DUF465 family)